tara:strand:- start:267 stop:1709 length:1443 start_codon:yes stop_codon:yes gene_type:complete
MSSDLIKYCQENNADKLKNLIKQGSIDLNEYVDRITPIAACILGSSNACLRILLNSGANANKEVQEDSGITPLGFAISKGNIVQAKLLIKSGAKTDTEITVRATDFNGDPQSIQMGLLHVAAQRDADTFSELLNLNAFDINKLSSSGASVLSTALFSRDIYSGNDIANLLLDKKTRIDCEENKIMGTSKNILFSAFLENSDFDEIDQFIERENLIERLLKQGASTKDIDFHGNTLLKRATRMGSLKFIKKFIDEGIDPNIEDSSQYTAIMNAATIVNFCGEDERIDGSAEATKLLINAGANISHISKSNETAIKLAINYNNYQTALILAQNGAELPKYARGDKDLQSNIGKTGTELPLWVELFTQIRHQEDVNRLIEFIDLGLDLTNYIGKDTQGRKVSLSPYGVLECRDILADTFEKNEKGLWLVYREETWFGEHGVYGEPLKFSQLKEKIKSNILPNGNLVEIDDLNISQSDIDDYKK